MGKHTKLQFVWPKDGPKGRGGRKGFFGRLDDILKGTGPDIFIQKRGTREPITPDFWGNWDSYHDRGCHDMEHGDSWSFGPFTSSRGEERYDPNTRRYVKWSHSNDWNGHGIYGHGIGPNGDGYPRFTKDERTKMLKTVHRGHRIRPHRMGEEWSDIGPKRFRPEYDWYWQEAHRRGENRREGFHPLADINPHMRMHQGWPDCFDQWIRWEGIA